MTDIAQLTYSVDSSGLAAAERALDSHTQAAERTSQATEQLEDRYKAIARRGMEYAEAMRSGNVSERAQAEAAREAALGIDTKARVMQGAGTQAERMAQRVEAIRVAEEREARVAAESARQKALQDLNLRKLLGSIDPTIAKLERLGQLEGNLERALDVGAISPEIFDQYQAKIDATRAATLNMGKAQDIATASVGRLNLNTVEAQQSMVALARAMATGQWGVATSSITSLTARTGAMGGMFSTAGLAIGGAVAALGLFTVQAGKGYFESRRMEGVILGMGNAAGVTAGQMLELRNEIGRATGDYAGATQAVNQLLLSGRATGEALENAARAAGNFARLTGVEIGTVTSELTGLADGGAEALQRWNDKYNVLTASTLQQIEATRRQDGELAAFTATMREAERVSSERTQKMREQAGYLERAWQGVTSSVRDAIQAVRDYGRSDLEAQLVRARRTMESMRLGAGMQDPESYGPYVQARAAVQAIEDQIAAERDAESRREANRKAELDYTRDALASEREREERVKASNAALEQRMVQMDREYAKQQELKKLREDFAGLSAEDPRLTDGTYERMHAAIVQKYAERRQAVRAVRAEIDEEARANERLESQFARQEQNLTRQIALYGQSSRAAATAYDIAVSGLDQVNPRLAERLRLSAAILDQLDAEAEVQRTLDKLDQDRWDEQFKGKTDEMSEYARQAARNMQSHFANFLFDPFADGTKSMGDQFSETLRRMMAEAAASKLFEVLGGAMSAYSGSGAGWINAIGGVFSQQSSGRREHGGPVSGQGLYRVGERNKPELLNTPNGQYLIPGEQGSVVPMGHSSAAGRTPQININVMGNAEVESATARQNSSGGFDVDVILKQMVGAVAGDIAGGGPVWQAIKGRGGLRDAV